MPSRRAWIVIALCLGAACLLFPTLLVGHPDIFPDTSAYELVGQWFLEQAGLNTTGAYGYLHHRADLGMFFTMAGARSPYYGVLLYAVTDRGSAWAMAAIQALLASALIALTLRVILGRFRLIEYAAVIGLMTAASTLPYFVSFVMPDVYLGLGALAAILLLFYFDALSKIERWALGVGLLVSLLFHATNPPVVFAAALVAALAIWLKVLPGAPARRGLAIVVAAIGLSVAAGFLYPAAVRDLAHRELSRPPFISARLLADGPGRDYLLKACAAGQPFVLCRFQDLPMTDANTILWAAGGRRGVFEDSRYATRLELTHQEPRFVIGVFENEPLRTAWLLARDSFYELTDVSVLDTFGYFDHGLIARGPRFAPPFPEIQICVRRPNYCFSSPFQRDSEDALRWGLIAATLYMAARLACGLGAVRSRLRLAPLPPRLAAAAVGVTALLLADAAICGALSGVYARYEMRAIWLAPLFAGLAWLQASPRSLRRRGAGPAPVARSQPVPTRVEALGQTGSETL